LLERQHGLLSLSQAERFGVTMSALRYRTRDGGPWQRIFPGVYLTVPDEPTVDQLDMAATLYAGKDGMLTGLAALRRLQIPVRTSPFVDVLVPQVSGRASRSYVRIHRTARLPSFVLIDREIQMATAPRAVIDATRHICEVRELRAIVAAAVQERMCTPEQLETELRRGKLRNSETVRSVLAEVRAGIRSAPEGDLMDLVKRARLPTPLYNPRLYLDGEFLAIPDAWWKEVSVAAEVDSRQWHFAPEAWERTMLRHDRMAAAGIRVLHFSPKQIRTEPDMVIATIRQALATGAPSARIQTKPAAV
jgi:hypothetical protein